MNPETTFWFIVGMFAGYVVGIIAAEFLGWRVSDRVVDRLIEFAEHEDEDEAA